MKARTRSDSPESDHSGKREGQVKFSESNKVTKTVAEVKDDTETSRTDDSVFEEPKTPDSGICTKGPVKTIPIEIHFKESLT